MPYAASPSLLCLAPTVGLLVAGCAPRLHSPRELSAVATRCEVPANDLIQDSDLKKVLFLLTEGASGPQIDCVHRWARKHRLHLSYLEAVERTGP